MNFETAIGLPQLGTFLGILMIDLLEDAILKALSCTMVFCKEFYGNTPIAEIMHVRTLHVFLLVRVKPVQKGEDFIMIFERLDSFSESSPNTIRFIGSDQLFWVPARAHVRAVSTMNLDYHTSYSKGPVGF